MENRKKQIIDLAIKLVQKKGYVGFSYDDISKQLGVTKASIHYHFEKKEDLGVAITEHLATSLQTFLLINASDSVEEKLKKFILQAERFACTEICPISSLQTDFNSLPDIVQKKIEEVSRLELSIMKELVAEAQTEKILNDTDDIQSVAVTILSSIKGALLYRRVLGDDILAGVINQINLNLRKS
ncbi:TetR/AcrR family transcriptional regulator [Metabacillus dongyingensis]|uniref:TetR/AcrR family transcriptional regulator n=1 Tax=Metabacillus dongyingensis TaxID=2874282 RepID=UPI001FB55E48|nr:TetR/AcrR family transcriptional regulator [Metabacillus dongyingensis]UNJ81434.1 Transcriptional regulator, AcrR family [Metabacillus dongyingensis]